MYHHPKYYKELRKRAQELRQKSSSVNQQDLRQPTSFKHGGRRKRPTVINQIHDAWARDHGYKASSAKQEAPSPTHKASSSKPQATSSMIREPENI